MNKRSKLLSIIASFSLMAAMVPAAAFGAVTSAFSTSTDAQADAYGAVESELPEGEATQTEDDGVLNIGEGSSDSAITTLADLSGLTVCIDPGHRDNEYDYGATGNGMREADLTLTIAQACKAELEKYGVTVVMTRNSNDETIGLTDRVNKAIAANADVFFSIHINSTENATGYEVWVQRSQSTYNSDLAEDSAALGNAVLNNLSFTGIKNRGLKTSASTYYTYPDGSTADQLSVLRNSRQAGIPAVLVEHAFINGQSQDVELLQSTEKLQQMGVADAQAIIEQFANRVTWSWPYIKQVKALGIMQGSNGDFRPYDAITRGEAATVIYRAKTGASTTEATTTALANTFADVADNQFYTRAINWCYQNGYMTGDAQKTSDGKVQMRPNEAISREELATIIWRIAGQPSVTDTSAYYSTADYSSVTDYAVKALQWTAAQDILSGKVTSNGKYLDPKASTTREEAAKIFANSYDYLQGYSIMGQSQVTVAQMVARYNSTGHTYPSELAQYGAATIEEFCQLLYDEAAYEGVRAEVVFAQAMKETGWLQSSYAKNQCNFCGLGVTYSGAPGVDFTTGVNFDETEHWNTWDSVCAGLRGQIQHLKAYATSEAPNHIVVDPRYSLVSKGCSPMVEGLGARWATSYAYGSDIVRMIAEIK